MTTNEFKQYCREHYSFSEEQLHLMSKGIDIYRQINQADNQPKEINLNECVYILEFKHKDVPGWKPLHIFTEIEDAQESMENNLKEDLSNRLEFEYKIKRSLLTGTIKKQI